MRLNAALLLTAVVLHVAGCSSKLDTGYTPVPLSDGASARRAYYAEPFSPEAGSASEDRQQMLNARKPTP